MSRGLRGFVNRTLADAIRDATGLLTWRDVTREQVYFVNCDGMRLRDREYSSQIQPPTWAKKKKPQLDHVCRKLFALLEQKHAFMRVLLVRDTGKFDHINCDDVEAFFDEAKEASRKFNRMFLGTGVEIVALAENVKLLADGRLSPDIHLLFDLHPEVAGDADEIRHAIATAITGMSLGGIRVAQPPQHCSGLLRTVEEVQAHISYLHEYPIKIYSHERSRTKVTFERGIRAEWDGVLQNPQGVAPIALVRAALCFFSPTPVHFYDYALGAPSPCFHMRQSVRTMGQLSGRTQREDRNNNSPDCCERESSGDTTSPDLCEGKVNQSARRERDSAAAARRQATRKVYPRVLREELRPHPDFPALCVTLAIVQHPPASLAALCRALPLLGRRLVFERAALDCLRRGGTMALAMQYGKEARANWMLECCAAN